MHFAISPVMSPGGTKRQPGSWRPDLQHGPADQVNINKLKLEEENKKLLASDIQRDINNIAQQ